MNEAFVVALVLSTAAAATPLILAALGELVVERAGVLNLGVEGMMLAGAVSAFAVTTHTGSATAGFAAGMGAGLALSALFALLSLGLMTNQVATGLALTLFGVGLSAFAGQPFVGQVVSAGVPRVLGLDLVAWLAIALCPLLWLFLQKSRAGLLLRAVGERPEVADAIGFAVRRIRLAAVLFGGALAGLAGAYLSLVNTPMWAEGMTAGRGWIALALVVFATWRPLRVLAGAWLFGGMTVLQLHTQALGLAIPSEFLSMLPYLATVVVLVLICRDPRTILLNQPLSLGKPYHPDR
ncbi:ABC transporter permease [Crenobacter caeni]|uniref:ABC transporter permease n=1 Tax=Crenobacter caeni TaxID=2705474 RepID=A0A6B2KMI3_9NEIS|nr:ABC transporter permease [Crenobacter caeni]NDV11400.1 ABC transporter permease [Crenobacter caeni]